VSSNHSHESQEYSDAFVGTSDSRTGVGVDFQHLYNEINDNTVMPYLQKDVF